MLSMMSDLVRAAKLAGIMIFISVAYGLIVDGDMGVTMSDRSGRKRISAGREYFYNKQKYYFFWMSDG